MLPVAQAGQEDPWPPVPLPAVLSSFPASTPSTAELGPVVLADDPCLASSCGADPDFAIKAFSGREWDPETELYYYRARYYDPKVGRFISEDPIGFFGGLNFYVYAGQNPVNFLDSFGLELVPVDLPGLGRTYLDDAIVPNVNQFIEEARRRGVEPHFNSAYRTPERQEALRNDPRAVTPARQSLHSCGFAVDVNYSSLPNDAQRRALREAAAAARLDWGGDFRNPDPPHFYNDPGGDRAEQIREAAERYRQLTRPQPAPAPPPGP